MQAGAERIRRFDGQKKIRPGNEGRRENVMKCEEFQRGLPEFMEGNRSPEAIEHLKQCDVCSDLVEDLNYIAEAAKLLLPMQDPSPAVWDGIERSIHGKEKPRASSASQRA